MSIREFGLLYWVVVVVLALLIASPLLSRVLVYPRTEFFTELWILDADHKAESYPFNITRAQNYSIYLGVGNRLGYCAYYSVQVKFRNQTQEAPTSFGPIENRSPSSLPSLFNITAFVADEATWETSLTFSFSYGFNQTLSEVEFYNLTLNDVVLDLRGSSSAWNATVNRFYGNMVFELWLFNSAIGVFQYHGRYVDLKLNMTVT